MDNCGSFLIMNIITGYGSMGGLLVRGAATAAAAYGAHQLAHGAHHPGYGGYNYGYGHGKFKHGKFGKHWKNGMYGKHKFKKWK